ncbi:hypothetical protein RJ639_020682 [Escallonia herrerae]|uniref:Uncharacterized protein n=1 Tax=Escallonia herrerae TaxID=1293975 RepID=A0AA89AG74_9ASTE|nr:hypothetical protein RJ639_020682 [Escallonia herrerae]
MDWVRPGDVEGSAFVKEHLARVSFPCFFSWLAMAGNRKELDQQRNMKSKEIQLYQAAQTHWPCLIQAISQRPIGPPKALGYRNRHASTRFPAS